MNSGSEMQKKEKNQGTHQAPGTSSDSCLSCHHSTGSVISLSSLQKANAFPATLKGNPHDLEKSSDAQWHLKKKRAPFFCWLSLKGNPDQKDKQQQKARERAPPGNKESNFAPHKSSCTLPILFRHHSLQWALTQTPENGCFF